jgi:hypothetical protein
VHLADGREVQRYAGVEFGENAGCGTANVGEGAFQDGDLIGWIEILQAAYVGDEGQDGARGAKGVRPRVYGAGAGCVLPVPPLVVGVLAGDGDAKYMPRSSTSADVT